MSSHSREPICWILVIVMGLQSEAECKTAEGGRLEQQKLKEEAARAYSTMDESLQQVPEPIRMSDIYQLSGSAILCVNNVILGWGQGELRLGARGNGVNKEWRGLELGCRSGIEDTLPDCDGLQLWVVASTD